MPIPDMTPNDGQIIAQTNGRDYVSNRAVTVAPGACRCSDILRQHGRNVRLCRIGDGFHFYLPASKVKQVAQ